jgi:hypothetical protein
MALRLLKSVLPRPTFTRKQAEAIVGYHLKRNRIAKASHYKSWFKRHRKVKFKLLL